MWLLSSLLYHLTLLPGASIVSCSVAHLPQGSSGRPVVAFVACLRDQPPPSKLLGNGQHPRHDWHRAGGPISCIGSCVIPLTIGLQQGRVICINYCVVDGIRGAGPAAAAGGAGDGRRGPQGMPADWTTTAAAASQFAHMCAVQPADVDARYIHSPRLPVAAECAARVAPSAARHCLHGCLLPMLLLMVTRAMDMWCWSSM
jgi:hypothetical protein